jgi:phage tail sheath protein FI
VARLRYTLSKAQQGDLAQSRINTLLYKNGVGFVPGDTLTRSTDPNFRFIHTRVIFNCLERTIYKTLDASGLLHESIGGRNLFYLRLKMTVEGVVARFYDGGALYGITADGAYAVNCDETIQNNADLEAGIVNVDVYAVPAANARQIRNTVYRVQIGNIPQALLTGGV